MKKVLVIDPNKSLTQDLVSLLKTFKGFSTYYPTIYVNSLFEDIKKIMSDIVFINIENQYFDGFCIAKEIKKNNPNVKVIYLSNSENFATEAFEENATDYLVYPVTRERLEKTLKRAI